MNITKDPLDFCLLIPHFNNFSGLIKSIKSVQYDQERFLILIVDDGSSTSPRIEDLQESNISCSHIKIITLEENKGITYALNSGLKWIRENLNVLYIARLDCGDICHHERFKKQVSYLNSNPKIHLLGSWCIFKSPLTSDFFEYVTPTLHREIKYEMHFRNAFIHPTVIFRSSLLSDVDLYPKDYELVEDYAFFWNTINKFKSAILNEFLVTCEINQKGISISKRTAQLKARKRIIRNFAQDSWLMHLGILKLSILEMLPYKLILNFKIYKSKLLTLSRVGNTQ